MALILLLQKLLDRTTLRWRTLYPLGQNEDEMIGTVMADVDEEVGNILEGKRWSQDWTYDFWWKFTP